MHTLAATPLAALTDKAGSASAIQPAIICHGCKLPLLTSQVPIGAATKVIVKRATKNQAQQDHEACNGKHGGAAGIYGAEIPMTAAQHHHSHTAGHRARISSRPNPFSRAASLSSFSRKDTGRLPSRDTYPSWGRQVDRFI